LCLWHTGGQVRGLNGYGHKRAQIFEQIRRI